MKRMFTKSLVALTLAVGVMSMPLAPTVGAIDVFSGSCGSNSSDKICGASSKDDAPSMIKSVINILLYLVGIIAVVAIIIGGIRYVTSNGDAGAIKSAKDTIMYAVVGIVVAIMAYTIVNFVVTQFK